MKWWEKSKQNNFFRRNPLKNINTSRASCSHFCWLPFFVKDWVFTYIMRPVGGKFSKLTLLLCFKWPFRDSSSINNVIKYSRFSGEIMSFQKENKLTELLHQEVITMLTLTPLWSFTVIITNNLQDFSNRNICLLHW